MSEFRRFTAEDLIQLNKLHTIVYNLRNNYSKEEKQENDPLEHPAHWACGIFEKDKLIAGMLEIDYLMRFDGHSVKMSGIGGVGTLPEARKGGYVRRIMEKILPESYENGVIFSCLTPFSHEFYRKFGYEITCPRNKISISTGDFPDTKLYGEFVHILPGDDTSMLAEVHSAYITNINQGIHRDYWQDNRAWKCFTNQDPYTTGTYLYLWKDESGKPKGYIKYEDEYEDGDHNMQVKELAFTDRQGLYGTLGIISGLSAQFENFKWNMPAFIDPCDFIDDAWSIEMNTDPKDMSRVINVKAALELMRRPHCAGEYVIETEDKDISANNGKYLVEFGADGTKVSKTTRDADISCDILTLSQLVIGYRTLENAMYSRREGLEIHGNIETLKRVFTQRPQHITEYF
jgi:predicted acetyltransferase